MRKIVAVLLLVVCLFLCGVQSLAAAKLSDQYLTVDDRPIFCEKYNIDGNNYFKLRDVAFALNGTPAQFDVEWDPQTGIISVTTGVPYKADGSELDLSGSDKSATAVARDLLLQIDGRLVSGVSAYNIGGNNYLKLRDMGYAFGFFVGYDAPSRTATVASGIKPTKPACRIVRTETETEEKFYFSTEKTRSESNFTYDNLGRLLCQTNTEYRKNGSVRRTESYTYRYDEKGQIAERIWLSEEGSVQNTETISYTYFGSGEIAKMVYQQSDGTLQTLTRQYDQKGRLQSEMVKDAKNRVIEVVMYNYNGMGDLYSVLTEDKYGYTSVLKYSYTYDAAGKVLQKVTSGQYSVLSIVDYTYNDDGSIATMVTKHGYNDTETKHYFYDAAGLLSSETRERTSSKSSKITYFYDIYGNEVCVKEEKIATEQEKTTVTTVTQWETVPEK